MFDSRQSRFGIFVTNLLGTAHNQSVYVLQCGSRKHDDGLNGTDTRVQPPVGEAGLDMEDVEPDDVADRGRACWRSSATGGSAAQRICGGMIGLCSTFAVVAFWQHCH